MLHHFRIHLNLAFPDHSNRADRMETNQTHLRAKSKLHTGSAQQQLTSTNSCGQRSSPKTTLPASIPWHLAPRSLVYTITLSYTHCLRGKARQAAGWPLSTGLVLLPEMNRCCVGVGETGCGELSRGGSGCLGVPGDSREQLTPQLPASLALQALHSSPPRDCWIWPFFSSPSRGSAAGTTNPSSDERLHFHFVSPTGICPDTFRVSIRPTGVWVGRICSGGGWKIPQKPLTSPTRRRALADPRICGLWGNQTRSYQRQ